MHASLPLSTKNNAHAKKKYGFDSKVGDACGLHNISIIGLETKLNLHHDNFQVNRITDFVKKNYTV